MSPTLIIVVTIVVLPLLWSILISFQRLRLINVGRASLFEPLTLANYERVLGSGVFWTSLVTTFVYTFGSVVLAIGLGLLAAMAARAAVPGPDLRPGVVPAALCRAGRRRHVHLAHHAQPAVRHRQRVRPGGARLGPAHRVPLPGHRHLDLLGLEIPVPTALLTTIAFEGWRYFPFAFLFLMARLEAMSGEPEEAALVDGATPWQSFRHIVFPQLVPIIGSARHAAHDLDLQRVRRHLPAHRRGGGDRRGQRADLQLSRRPTQRRRGRGAVGDHVRWCWSRCSRSISLVLRRRGEKV